MHRDADGSVEFTDAENNKRAVIPNVEFLAIRGRRTRTARTHRTWNTAPIQNALVLDAKLPLWNFHSGNPDGWKRANSASAASNPPRLVVN